MTLQSLVKFIQIVLLCLTENIYAIKKMVCSGLILGAIYLKNTVMPERKYFALLKIRLFLTRLFTTVQRRPIEF